MMMRPMPPPPAPIATGPPPKPRRSDTCEVSRRAFSLKGIVGAPEFLGQKSEPNRDRVLTTASDAGGPNGHRRLPSISGKPYKVMVPESTVRLPELGRLESSGDD